MLNEGKKFEQDIQKSVVNDDETYIYIGLEIRQEHGGMEIKLDLLQVI